MLTESDTSKAGVNTISRAEESSRARSDAEFCSKIDGALQEADESKLWIELLREDCGIDGAAVEHLHRETNELLAILATMARKTKRHLR